jgi:hypothetical protein
LKHIQQEHQMQWHYTMATHRPIVFSDKAEFKTHMSTEHKGKYNQSQLATLIRRGARPATHAFDECPLGKAQCKDVNGEENLAKDLVINNHWPRHVAGHLKTLALMFLPPGDNAEEGGTDEACSSTTKKSSRAVDADSIFELSLTFDDEASLKEDHDDTEWTFLPQGAYEGHGQDLTLKKFVAKRHDMDAELGRSSPHLIASPRPSQNEKHLDLLACHSILDALRFSEMTDRYEEIPEACENTFAWVYGDITPWSSFKKWLESQSGIYWINGKAGSGKSTLMKFLVGNLQTQESLNTWACNATMEHQDIDEVESSTFVENESGIRDDGTGNLFNEKNSVVIKAAYFFWNSGVTLQRRESGMLRSLLYQVLKGRSNSYS